jgi:LmbE family N-acetylglucosaminyl deacetylase
VIDSEEDWAALVSDLPPLACPTARHVVVVAPHPDDETLGIGGAIYDWTQLGVNVQVLIATDGGKSHDHPNIKNVRRDETLAAAIHLGVDQKLIFLDLPDANLSGHLDALVDALDATIPSDGFPALVIAPRLGDGHSDHDAAAIATTLFATRRGPQVDVWRYGVWTWVTDFQPELLKGCMRWDLTEKAQNQKRLAVQEYRSQISTTFGAQIVTDDLLRVAGRDTEVLWCNPRIPQNQLSEK